MNNTTLDGPLDVFDEHIASRIVRLILYPAVFIIGVIGNSIVCALILKAKSKQFRSAEGYFILNLAFSDLLVIFLYLPFDLAYLENHAIWPFGFVLCKLINVLTSISVTVSGSMLICIGFERYTTIVRTLTGRLSKRKALVMVTFSWIYSCLAQIPYVFALQVEPDGTCLVAIEWWPSQVAMNLTYIMAIIMPQFVIPAFCLTFFYLRIVCHVWKAHRLNSKRGIYSNTNVAEKRVKQNRKTTKLLTGLVLVYAICILPHMVIIISIMANPALLSSNFTRQLYEFARLLKTANSCFNPILYTLLIRGFRNDLKKMCCNKAKSNTNSLSKKFLRSSPEIRRPEYHKTLSPSQARFQGTITVKLENGYDCEREDRV
ncbi:RYamide receptor-like [Montipora capricornis]|uniref:RYamide receptor-like n=1 Tax=Montipora capricornis TaxID=246305 RepID=UPI0035F2175B